MIRSASSHSSGREAGGRNADDDDDEKRRFSSFLQIVLQVRFRFGDKNATWAEKS